MRTIISTHFDETKSDPMTQYWVYNGMDCCVTHELHEALETEDGGFAYLMSRAMQGPALTMIRRGVNVDKAARSEMAAKVQRDLLKYKGWFERLTLEGLGERISPTSPIQLRKLFYELLALPEIRKYNKATKERTLTTDADAIEKLQTYQNAAIFCTLLLAIRDCAKQLQVLTSGIDPDGRFRCHYYVAGTYTGRWSSAKNVHSRGGNMQNIAEPLRIVFTPDKGKKMGNVDLRQAESVIVAALSNDDNYIDAVKSGDPHTYVCELVWPELPWREANSKSAKKAIANRKYYRHFTYRDMAKKGGHGSNYGGTPPVLAMHLKIEQAVARSFQEKYFDVFKGIRRWQTNTEQEVATKATLNTVFGRRCQFFSRPSDTKIIKEAIAYRPQSTIGDYLNLGLYLVWLHLDLPGHLELLGQVHDSIFFQYDPKDEHWILPKIQELMRFALHLNGKEWFIETEVAVGWNWAKRKVDSDGHVINHYGLEEWTGKDERQSPKERSLLDRRVCDLHPSLK